MNQEEKNQLIATIARLQTGRREIGPQEAERLLIAVLQPLLEEDGYEVGHAPAGSDGGIDFLAKRPSSADYQSQTVGIEFKYYGSGKPVGVAEVRQLVGTALLRELDRAILLVNTHFTKAARDAVRREMPFDVELIDLDSLRTWADRLAIDQAGFGSEVRQILQVVSRRFATLIAKDPRVLDELEWRDIERMMAEVFDGLGFSVTLTAPSKDGGKDVVLECVVQGKLSEYVVEIKHWRAGGRVGGSALRNFLNVIARERRDGGLFLSTYGYCDNAFEQLSEIDRQRLRFGNEEKVVALCRTYVKAASGLWSPPENLAEVLYESTM